MYIGNVEIKNNTVLAPMAGVTDKPFRMLCKEKGAGLLVSEMVSAKGILYNNKKTLELMEFDESERPFSVQLFGSDPGEVAQAAQKAQELSPDMIDINMGCPVPKVVNNGEGSALLKNPDLCYEIMARVADAINIPLMVKVRSGWDENSINAPQIAELAEKAGVAAIAVHARTRGQFYSGNADWNVIKKVVQAVNIPVIGNGDIKSASDAKTIMQDTGCAAVMIGRAAEGNPWIFAEIKADVCAEGYTKPDLAEKFAMMKRHLAMLIEYKGEIVAVKEMRRHASSYCKGLPYAAEFRNTFNNGITQGEFERIFDKYFNKLLQIKS